MSRLILILALVAAPAHAEERILFYPPEGFVEGYSASNTDGGIVEFVPEGESFEDWTEMATLTWTNALAGQPAGVMAGLMVDAAKSQCAEGEAAVVHEGTQGAYPFVIVTLYCPVNTQGAQVSESAFVKVVSGAEAAYTFQYAWQGAADDAAMQDFMQWTVPQGLCEPGDAARACPAE